LRKFIPNEIRLAIFVVIIAGCVTITQLLMEAFAPPAINEGLGIFIPLIVVNCLVFARVEIFASQNGVLLTAVDGLGMGIGFTIGLTILGICREILGSGSIFGIELLTDPTAHVLIMLMAPGAFFMLGILIMIMQYFRLKRRA
jgi:electron transport complex protein RnfE